MELLVAAYGLVLLVATAAWLVVDWLAALRKRRRARIERELDRKQAELRIAIFGLASQLGADAHEARKALIRESYLASGRVPPRPE